MNNIKRLRVDAGYTQKALARKIGVCQGEISLIEMGRRGLTLEMAVYIGNALDVEDLRDLLQVRS